MRELEHGRAACIKCDVAMQALGRSEECQLYMELKFLEKIKNNVCVVVSSRCYARVNTYRHLFKHMHFIFLSKTPNDEIYDPCNHKLSFKYGSLYPDDVFREVRRRDRAVVLMCDGETLEFQQRVYFDLRPMCALLQIEPPYPSVYLDGRLLYPVFCESLMAGMLYLECARNARRRTWDTRLLHCEMFAFQLLTRGPTSDEQYDAGCRAGFPSLGVCIPDHRTLFRLLR